MNGERVCVLIDSGHNIFSMVGILVQIAISWFIVWLFEKGNLSCLGLVPSKKRVINFLFFFLITAACAASGFLLRYLIAKQSWEVNPDLSIGLVLNGAWFTVKSVLFEELIFRGVLLYILIKKLGPAKAIFISAIAFGIYHWFSHELWGNPEQMAIEFFVTGSMGLVLAYGYFKSNSLLIPIAIHLGWNIVQMVIFSGNTIGDQIFVQLKEVTEVTISYLSFFTILLFPLISSLLINAWFLKKYK